jgi:DNA-directed RNA polymerase subunit RPC12/RpoP
VKCPHCGAEYQEGEEEAGFECMICASEVAPDAKFCSRCGTVFLDDVEAPEEVIKQIGDHGRKRKTLKEMEMDDKK